MQVSSKPSEKLTVVSIYCLLSIGPIHLYLIFEKSSLKLFQKSSWTMVVKVFIQKRSYT